MSVVPVEVAEHTSRDEVVVDEQSLQEPMNSFDLLIRLQTECGDAIPKELLFDVDSKVDEVPPISMDFMYLHETGEHPILVAADHSSGRVWS